MADQQDMTAVRERYEQERDRRLRSDGMAQFTYLDPLDDPGKPRIEREPLFDEIDVAVIGAGLSGLSVAAKLRSEGVERIRVIDRAGDFGGTWYWNRYPGAQCDIESYIYIPLLEEVGYVPTQKYAYQGEIFGHCQAIGRKFELYDDACFHTDVTGLEWDDVISRWIVRTNRGDEMRASFVVVAGGFLQLPKLPAIPGIDTFEGKVFHTSRWDYEYTGGEPGPTGGVLSGLADKKVGIVGTGATGLQCVPPVGANAEQLYVFQRTPSTVLERNNKPTDQEWAKSLKPGWQAERMYNFTHMTSGYPVDADLIDDKWTEIYAPMVVSHAKAWRGGPPEQDVAEALDLEVMEKLRRRVEETVLSPEDAEALKPYYRFLCKRPGYHDDYLNTFNRPNVTLVDTAGRGIEKITPTGVVAGGREYQIDCLILATGFDTGRGLLPSTGLEIVGRDGKKLSDYWQPSMKTYQGFHTHGYPNCFFLGLTQTGGTVNFTHGIVEQAAHIAHIVGTMRSRGLEVVETTEEAQEGWVETIRTTGAPGRVQFLRDCTPSYLNNEGAVDDPNRWAAGSFPGGPVAFFQMLSEWREDGTMSGLVAR